MQRVRSWTVQNEMRVSTGAAGRILDSANPREIRAYRKAVSLFAVKTRENTPGMTREQKLLGENRGNLCVEEFR